MGSLVAAVASYLSARSRGGEWLVRMEDLDVPRVVPGAADHILRTLDAFGFRWDGEVLFQSRRVRAYADVLEKLEIAGMVFPCSCTRRDTADVYPGTCRSRPTRARKEMSWRVRTDDQSIRFRDRWLGEQEQRVESTVGDFVVQRADGIFTYQLAVVVDDGAQGITEVVRGADLLDSTARQIYLQRLLDMNTPEYGHLPVVCDSRGEKLSKQTGAKAVSFERASEQLLEALGYLGQAPPEALCCETTSEIWEWALTHWDERKVWQPRA